MNSLTLQNVPQTLGSVSECGASWWGPSEPWIGTQREERKRLLGTLGKNTLLCKNLLHSCLEGGFDKLINLSFLLPKHSCHSNPSCTPKLCLFHMQNFSVFRCRRLLFPGSRTTDARECVSGKGLILLGRRVKSRLTGLPRLKLLPGDKWQRCPRLHFVFERLWHERFLKLWTPV